MQKQFSRQPESFLGARVKPVGSMAHLSHQRPPTGPLPQIASLDWCITNFSSWYQSNCSVIEAEIPGRTWRALREPSPTSPIFRIEFGNVTTRWIIKLVSVVYEPTGKEYWNLYLRLWGIEMKPSGDEPPPVKRRRIVGGDHPGAALAEMDVQCQLFLMPHSHFDVDANTYTYDERLADSTPVKLVSFGPNCTTVRLGWPLYSGHDRRTRHDEANQILNCLAKWVNPATLVNPDNVLRVRVTLTCVEIRKEPPSLSPSGLDVPTANLLTDLGRMLDSCEDADAVIKCGSDAIPVHKFILSVRSPVFKARFQSGENEASGGVIVVEETELSVMKQFLEFLYTAQVELFGSMGPDQVISLIAIADKYKVTHLKYICFKHVLASLNEENCGQLAVAAYLYNADDQQRNRIYDYVAEHWLDLGCKEEFGAFVEAHPAAFLKKPNAI